MQNLSQQIEAVSREKVVYIQCMHMMMIKSCEGNVNGEAASRKIMEVAEN